MRVVRKFMGRFSSNLSDNNDDGGGFLTTTTNCVLKRDTTNY